MSLKSIITADGSSSILNSELNEPYHSKHGAVAESRHVFIANGLAPRAETSEQVLKIFELGFGTGLNAILSYEYAIQHNKEVHYTGVEAFPLKKAIVEELNYSKHLNNSKLDSRFKQLHDLPWNKPYNTNELFCFMKINKQFDDFKTKSKFDLVFFDAFAPEKQPELWTLEVFEKMKSLMNPNAFLVTYCAKGEVRRRMQKAGFEVERLPGPPGKREMLRAIKL